MTKLEAAQLKNPTLDLSDEVIVLDYCPKMLGVGDELYNKKCAITIGSLDCEKCWNKKSEK